MINPQSIHPINNNCLVKLEPRYEKRIIYLGSDRALSCAREGVCLRSERYQDERVLVVHGGIPVNDDQNLVLVSERSLIRVGSVLQRPYVQIAPEEVVTAGLIDLPETFFSGWYKVVDTFPSCELAPGQRVLPIYGEPRIEMEDDSEYCSISAIGVVEC